MHSQIIRPSWWWNILPRFVIRLSVVGAIMVVSAEWSKAVTVRRDRIIDRHHYTPVPSMCESRLGFWKPCPWVGEGPYVPDDDAATWGLVSPRRASL